MFSQWDALHWAIPFRAEKRGTYISSISFLILDGAVKMADRVVGEIMGLSFVNISVRIDFIV